MAGQAGTVIFGLGAGMGSWAVAKKGGAPGEAGKEKQCNSH